jgi:hypothetical protein
MTAMRPHTDQPRGSKKVHRSLENLDEYNIEPPLLTSPRSLEACLRQGIEPEELVFRYYDSFFEQGVHEDLQEIRWKHYEKKRLEKLAQAREERQRLIAANWQAPVKQVNSSMVSDLNNSDDKDMSSAALKEQRAIESLKARRQQELEQMVTYELKLSQVAEEQQRALELDRQKAAQQQKEAQKRKKQWEELKRAKELQKAKDEVRQERLRKKAAQEEFEREQKRKAEEDAEEALRKQQAREREVQAKEMREEHRRQTIAIIEEQQRQVEVRRQQMAEKDARRIAEMQARQLEMMVKAEEERRLAAKRISDALEAQKELIRQQRENFHNRQARNAEKRAQYEKLQRAEIERRQQAAKDKREALERAFHKMEEIENKKKKQTIDKERQQEINMERVKEITEVEHKRKAERTKLKQADKREAVERLMRIREYERQQAVQSLQDDDARTTALADFKEKMLEERKAFKRQNDMERYRVIQSMEKMRQNPAKAVKGSC